MQGLSPSHTTRATINYDPIPKVMQPPAKTLLPDALTLFDHLADAVYLIEPDTSNIVWANRIAWESLGMAPDAILNHSVLSLQKDVHGLPQWSEIADIIRSSACYRFVGRHRHQAGHEIEVEVLTTSFDHDGRPYFLSVARDLSQQLAQRRDLENREKQLWFALNEASDGLWDWDVNSGTLYFSPQLKRMLGYGPDEMAPVLDTWKLNVHPDDVDDVLVVLEEHIQGKRARFEAVYRLRNRNGHYLWVHDRGRVCAYDASGKPARVVGMVQDISDRKQLEIQLQELASFDPLTGLPNRREANAFLEAQAHLCKRLNLPLGIAFLDVDHFKQVNDLYGHLMGDQVLKQVGIAIKDAVRASDMVCRWGGEEFLVIAPNTGLGDMRLVAEKIRLALVNALPDLPLEVTLSAGVSAASGSAIDLKTLIHEADSALYQAKTNGRNRVEPSLQASEPA